MPFADRQLLSMCSRAVLAGLLLCAGLVSESWSDGFETTLRGDDLTIDVTTRWVGNSQGGYYPVRIRLMNAGEPRELEFEIASERPGFPIVRRTILAEQNAALSFVLRIPMVGPGTAGRLVIKDDGEELEGLETNLTVPGVDNSGWVRPSMLVIADGSEPLDQFETGVDVALGNAGSASRGRMSIQQTDHEVIAPLMLPDSWIDYMGVDFVAISLRVLEAIPNSSRLALLQWVDAGGNLIVYSIDDQPQDSERLNRLLELDQRASAGAAWQGTPVTMRDQLAQLHMSVLGTMQVQRSSGGGFAGNLANELLGHVNPENSWPGPLAFHVRPLMLGRVIAFQGNPFPGTSLDWHWLMSVMTENHWQWTARTGMSARQPNGEFLSFLIPGVKGVPIFAFLALITLFTILIGPVNYFLMWKRKQLYLLVLTIPVLAFVTCVAMFSYSALAHGFGTKSRIRSLTVLDQRHQSAVVWSRAALHAGLAPSAGLEFDTSTAVLPIWPRDTAFDNGVVDWTEKQALKSGWLKSRTRTQMLTISHKAMRGRLDLGEPTASGLSVANGLEWDLRALVVVDRAGQAWYIEELKAGESGVMEQATDSNLARLGLLANEFAPELPEGVESENQTSTGFFFRGPRGRRGGMLNTQFLMSRSEKMIQQIREMNLRLPERGTFVGVFGENPDIELGIEDTTEEASTHFLFGYY